VNRLFNLIILLTWEYLFFVTQKKRKIQKNEKKNK